MKYRETTLLARTDLGASGTKVIDLNVLDVVSRIDITLESYTLGIQSAQYGANLPKIELVDGSEVLFSLSGLETQGLNIYDRKCPTMMGPFTNGGNYWLGTFGLDFGRFLYDPELAFDPKLFRNPQLRITYDQDACMSECNHNYCEIFAHCFDEKVVSPIGFLMSKEHHSYYADAGDAYAYVDLPTDYPLRQILVRGFAAGKDPTTVVDEARLSEDNDKRVVFDLELVRYRKRMQGIWTPIVEFWEEYGTEHTTTTYYRYFTPTSELTSAFGVPRTAFKVFANEDTMRGGYMQWHGETGCMFGGMVVGFLPNHCIQFPFGLPDEIDSWYDVTKKGSVRLRLYSAGDYGSATSISTILQQLRRY